MATVKLDDIPTLAQLYQSGQLHGKSSSTKGYNDKIALIRTDITKLKVDAIVNAANESLLGGGGVDGAVHRGAGRHLLEECRLLNGCETGDAKITNAYQLPCKKVIHAVGPVYQSTKRLGRHTMLLQSCYTRSLDLLVANDLRSIAFSALSTGVYGYPSDEAADAAIAAVRGWLDKDAGRAARVDRIVFCSFLEKDEKAYEATIPLYFPPDSSTMPEDGRNT